MVVYVVVSTYRGVQAKFYYLKKQLKSFHFHVLYICLDLRFIVLF